MQIQTKRGVFHRVPLSDDFLLSEHGMFVMDDSPIVSLEYHDVLELGQCHEGSGIFVIGSKILPFRAGDISIISPGEMHFAQSQRGTKSTWTFLFADTNRLLLPHFPELTSFDIASYSGEDFFNVVSPRDNESLVEVVRALVREVRQGRAFHRTAAISYLAIFAAMMKRDLPITSTHTNIPSVRGSLDQVRKALEHIARHYHERIEIETLAHLCNMGQRNFARRFGEALKRSPHEYLLDTRIAMACSYLLKTDAPISFVAEECGFFTLTSFNRAFKERLSCSPREWRRRSAET